jgi:hypothetical protein
MKKEIKVLHAERGDFNYIEIDAKVLEEIRGMKFGLLGYDDMQFYKIVNLLDLRNDSIEELRATRNGVVFGFNKIRDSITDGDEREKVMKALCEATFAIDELIHAKGGEC